LSGLLSTQAATFDERGQRIPHRNIKPRAKVEAPTSDLARDLARGREDPVFFAERFLGIRLHRSQRKWIRAAAMRDGDFRPAFLTTIVSAGNRAGKTLGLAVIIVHHCFYKLGLRSPRAGDKADSLRWTSLPYHWYHVAPQQGIAELVNNEIVRIFSASHPAQFDKETGDNRGCPLVEQMGAVVSWDKKYRGEYLWIRFHPAVGGAEVHFRTTDEKAKALLGLDANGISIDEASFELYLDTIRHEVLNLRRLSTGGPLHAISTPTEGVQAFSDWWDEGDPANPHRDPKVISMRMSTRDNVGYGITQADFDDMLRQTPAYLVPQNFDGFFIEAVDAYFHAPAVEAVFDTVCLRCDGAGELSLDPFRLDHKTQCPSCHGAGEGPSEYPPLKDHRYAQGVDPGISSDATGSIVLDHTSRPIRGVRIGKRQGRQTIPAVVNMVRESHLLYQQDGAVCTTILDSTGMGGKMFRQEFSIVRPLREYDFAGTKAKKLELLSDLKAVIDRGDLKLPRHGIWLQVRRQLLGYKLDDKKLETDLVMALALAVRWATRHSGDSVANPTLRYFG
jgi:hypothetical protein